MDYTYKINTSKDDKNLEYTLNGINKNQVNNDEKAKKMAQKESEYSKMKDSVETYSNNYYRAPPRKETMINNKVIAFSSLVE